jgi:hypothetical protein
MTKQIKLRTEDFDDRGLCKLLDEDDVEPLCAKCGAPLSVSRSTIKPIPPATKSPIHIVCCSKNERHLHIQFHHRPSSEE